MKDKLLLLFITLFICSSCGEEPSNAPIVDYKYLPNVWLMENYQTVTTMPNGDHILTTPLDNMLSITYYDDMCFAISSDGNMLAEGKALLYPNSQSIEVEEYALLPGFEPEGVMSLLLPVLTNNILTFEELSERKMTLSMVYGEDVSLIANFKKAAYPSIIGKWIYQSHSTNTVLNDIDNLIIEFDANGTYTINTPHPIAVGTFQYHVSSHTLILSDNNQDRNIDVIVTDNTIRLYIEDLDINVYMTRML